MKIEAVDKSTKKMEDFLLKLKSEDEHTQTPSRENVTIGQALRDILPLMKKSKIFLNH